MKFLKIAFCLFLFSVSLFAQEKSIDEIRQENKETAAFFSEKFEHHNEVAASEPSTIVPQSIKPASVLDLKQVFSASPIIYSALFIMSVVAVVIWLYTIVTFRHKDLMPHKFIHTVNEHLMNKNYEEAMNTCNEHNHLLSSIIAAGISSRHHGPQVMIDSMKSEGRRASTALWQRLSLLNDIVVIAPMLGLLGTVIGMFYAFYDVNRSVESITALFDGLGIAVGTTVMGLIVAILAMVFYTTLKYRLVKTLSHVENEAVSLSALIDTKIGKQKEESSITKGSF